MDIDVRFDTSYGVNFGMSDWHLVRIQLLCFEDIDDCPFIMRWKPPCTVCSWRRRGMEALKAAANGRCLMCKSVPCYFNLLYISTFILLAAQCMLSLFVFPTASTCPYQMDENDKFIVQSVQGGQNDGKQNKTLNY